MRATSPHREPIGGAAMGECVDLNNAADELLRAIADRAEAALVDRAVIMRRLETVERLQYPETIARPDHWAVLAFRRANTHGLFVHMLVRWPPGDVLHTDADIAAAFPTIARLWRRSARLIQLNGNDADREGRS